VKSIQESAKNLELVKAYAEAIEQYGRNDLTYWKDMLFAKQLSDADALESVEEPVEVKKGTDAVTTKRKQPPSNAAALEPAKVDNKTSKKRKIGKSGFKYPPRVIAGIKVWGGDDMSDSGDEAVREQKKIKLEAEEDGDLFPSSVPQSLAPTLQASMIEEENIDTEQSLTMTSSAKKEIKLENKKNDGLFLSPPSQSQASGQRASGFHTYSGMFGRERTPIDRLSKAPDRIAESMRIASTSSPTTPSSPRFVRTQNSPSRPFFEKIMSPAAETTQNSPPRPPFEEFLSPSNPYNPNRPTLRDTFTECAAKRLVKLLSPSPQQPRKTQTSTLYTLANISSRTASPPAR